MRSHQALITHFLYPSEVFMIRLDDLFVHGWKIYQDTDGFCFGTDAILLSAFAAEKRFSHAVDLCCGTGILPLLLASYDCAKHVCGVEISPHSVDLARRSVSLNGIGDRVEILCEDLRSCSLPCGKADLVTANPPYFLPGSGKEPRKEVLIGRQEDLCTFSDVADCASRLLKFGGRFCFVHKPERLCEVLSVASACGLEPKVLRLVYPKADRPPELILVECKKGAASGLKVEPPFVLYESDGGETEMFHAVHRF